MKISIVTPALNQRLLLSATMNSILQQENPGLEYVVMDGGSSDGSRELIEGHQSRLASWVSQPDAGPYAALNNGFAKTTGEIMGWLNASDLHLPWTLQTVADVFARFPEVQWLTSLRPVSMDAAGRFAGMPTLTGFTRDGLAQGHFGLPNAVCIQQESTFWRRGLWETAGGRIPEGFDFAGDLALWAAFFQHAPLYGIEVPLGVFRYHAGQRSSAGQYADEALRVIHSVRSRPAAPHQRQLGLVSVRFSHEDRAAGWACHLYEGGLRESFSLGEGSRDEDVMAHIRHLESELYLKGQAASTLARALKKKESALAKANARLAATKSSLKETMRRQEKSVRRRLHRWWRSVRHGVRVPLPEAAPGATAGVSSAPQPLLRLWVAHHSNCENIGDRACNPLRYVPNPEGSSVEIMTLSLLDPKVASLKNQTIVLGGGGLLNPWCRDKVLLPLLAAGNTLIGWGIGHHHDHTFTDAHGRKETRSLPETIAAFDEDYAFLRHFALLGVRDHVEGWPYLPCPTCLHPAFDAAVPSPEHDAVVYEHAVAGPIPIEGFPKRNNHGGDDVHGIVPFLATGRTVITNSFHGAYWALLLGRAVLVYEPWCSKFFTFRQPLVSATRDDWQNRLTEAQGIPGYLSECRRLNHDFAARFWAEVLQGPGPLV